MSTVHSVGQAPSSVTSAHRLHSARPTAAPEGGHAAAHHDEAAQVADPIDTTTVDESTGAAAGEPHHDEAHATAEHAGHGHATHKRTLIRRPHLTPEELQAPEVGEPTAPPRIGAGELKSPVFLGTEAEYFKAARETIENAKPGDMLCLQMYEFENGATDSLDYAAKDAPGYKDQQALLPGLADAAKRGVKVNIILDNTWDSEKGEASNQPIVDYLDKHAGKTGNLQIDYYPSKSVNIDHAKELIHLTPGEEGEFLAQTALVGGSNWGNHTAANDDGGGAFYGRDAVGAAEIFFRDQAFCRGDESSPLPDTNDPHAPIRWHTTSPLAEGGGSHGILDAKMRLTKEASGVYLNEFCLTHKDLVDATAEKGKDAHARLDPNELFVNKNALWALRKAHGEAQWANTAMDAHMQGQKNHQKLDIYTDKDGVAFAATIGSANDTSNGLDTTHTVTSRTGGHQTKKTNHEIDAEVTRYTEGSYSTAPFLDAALAKTKSDLEGRSLDRPPESLSGTRPGQF